VEKFLANKMSQVSTLCTIALVSFFQAPVDFFLNSLRTKLFICSTSHPGLYSLVSWFIFPWRKHKSNKMNFEKCAYIHSFVKFGHIRIIMMQNIFISTTRYMFVCPGWRDNVKEIENFKRSPKKPRNKKGFWGGNVNHKSLFWLYDCSIN